MEHHPCVLCDEHLGPVLGDSEHWRLVLNRNQDLLGKCFLSLRRHSELVSDLSPEEWTELQQQIRIATHALQDCFRPDHFNYAFLQNQDRHVHLHVIPRYGAAREFAGERFVDPAFGDHYAVGGPARTLPQEATDELAGTLQEAINRAAERFRASG